MKAKSDISRNAFMLKGALAKCGYDWWWHSFTARNAETNEEKAFFIDFFACNPALGGQKPILGQYPEFRLNDVKPSYLMVKVGTWGEDASQLHRFFGWNEVEMGEDIPFSIKCDDCYLDEFSTKGSVSLTENEVSLHPEYMSDSGQLCWDLKIDKIIPFNVGYGASKPLRDIQAFEMFWHAEGMKTAYSGEVIWNNTKYDVKPENCYGYADKNWGKDFTSPWVWLSSNNLTSKITGQKLENSVFNIGGGRPKIGLLALPRKLLSLFYYEHESYEFNFSKFWTLTKTKFDCNETDTQIVWHVEQSTPIHKMITDITCEKKDMLLINYEAPNGKKRHNRLWNGGNGKGIIKLYKGSTLIDEIEAKNIGCEYGDYDNIK